MSQKPSMPRQRLIGLALLTALALLPRAGRAEHASGELIVRWRADVPASAPRARRDALAASAATRARPVVLRQLDLRTQLLRVAPDAEQDVLAALQRDPDVDFVEPNHIRRAMAASPSSAPPDDPLLSLQWHLRAIRAEQAWSVSTGDERVIVAVVDTGIVAHPALAGRTLPGYDFISDPQSAGDGDGRDADPTDDSIDAPLAHGTHVAGIIAAHADDGAGTAGIDWRARVLPVRVLDVNGGGGKDADIADAIRWAAGLSVPGAPPNPTPARVINLSFGAEGYGRALHEAIGDAMQAGAILVAAAGNEGVDARRTYPAAYPGVITVGATDAQGTLAEYSNYGFVVDLLAPGGNLLGPELLQGSQGLPGGILSLTFPDRSSELYTLPPGYDFSEGTSQATPMVSAVVALLLSVDPTLDQRGVADLLTRTADSAHRCDQGCGAGLLDAAAALAAAAGQASPERVAASVSTTGGPVVAVVGCSLPPQAGLPPPCGALWLALAALPLLAWRRTAPSTPAGAGGPSRRALPRRSPL